MEDEFDNTTQNIQVIISPKYSTTRRSNLFSNHSKKYNFAVKSALVGSIGGLLFGYDLGVISGALPYVKDYFNLSVYQQELVTSLMYAGCIFGATMGGSLCDYFGRRNTVFVVSIIFIVGALIQALAQTVGVLYFGRFVIGIGVAISAIVDVTYLNEISPIEFRGAVVSTNEFMITVGFLVAFVVDYGFESVDQGWRYMFGFPAILAIIWSSLMYIMPESPRWLLLQNRIDEATNVYNQIYNTKDEAIEATNLARQSIDSVSSVNNTTLIEVASQWKYSIFVAVSLMIFQNFSGNAGILAYAPEFFKYAGYGGSSGSLATIILGCIKVLSTAISLNLVDRIGRRVLLLAGVFGMTISLIILSILFVNVNVSNDDDSNSKLSSSASGFVLFLVCIYIGSYGIGYGPVTWLICSEMFSDEIRGRTLGFATVANWLSTLIVVGSFLSSADSIGLSYTLATYAIICGFAFAFSFILVPETALREPIYVVKELKKRFQNLFDCIKGIMNCNFHSVCFCLSRQNENTQLLFNSPNMNNQSQNNPMYFSEDSSHNMLGSKGENII